MAWSAFYLRPKIPKIGSIIQIDSFMIMLPSMQLRQFFWQKQGIKFIGIDYLSISPYDDLKAPHQILLNAGIVILENAYLVNVEAGEYTLFLPAFESGWNRWGACTRYPDTGLIIRAPAAYNRHQQQ